MVLFVFISFFSVVQSCCDKAKSFPFGMNTFVRILKHPTEATHFTLIITLFLLRPYLFTGDKCIMQFGREVTSGTQQMQMLECCAGRTVTVTLDGSGEMGSKRLKVLEREAEPSLQSGDHCDRWCQVDMKGLQTDEALGNLLGLHGKL